MNTRKKGFFSIPTWILVLFCFVFFAATLFDIYLLLNIDSFKSISVNGIEYSRGTEEYISGIKKMKQSFGYSMVVTSVLFVVAGLSARKRLNSKK